MLDGEHVISTAMDDTIRFAKKDEPHNVEFTTSLATEGLHENKDFHKMFYDCCLVFRFAG